jgi:hypothetical protein
VIRVTVVGHKQRHHRVNDAAGLEDTHDLGAGGKGIADVFEGGEGEDGVEGAGGEWKRFVEGAYIGTRIVHDLQVDHVGIEAVFEAGTAVEDEAVDEALDEGVHDLIVAAEGIAGGADGGDGGALRGREKIEECGAELKRGAAGLAGVAGGRVGQNGFAGGAGKVRRDAPDLFGL